MADLRRFQFNLPRTRRPGSVVVPDLWYPDIQRCWETGSDRRRVDPILGVRAVASHATAGASSASAISVIKRSASAA
jgi:hypothetical protein